MPGIGKGLAGGIPGSPSRSVLIQSSRFTQALDMSLYGIPAYSGQLLDIRYRHPATLVRHLQNHFRQRWQIIEDVALQLNFPFNTPLVLQKDLVLCVPLPHQGPLKHF